MKNELTIVKLGGSLITHKDRPLSVNLTSLRVVAREISTHLLSNKTSKLILIHGGGSFGHFFAKQFALTTRYSKYDPEGVALTLTSMLQLHSLILEQMNSKEVFCATILPSELMSLDGKTVTANGLSRINSIFSCGLIPITLGNILLRTRTSRIISGDEIALLLARRLHAARVIFALDVDGIYPTSDLSGNVLSEVSSRDKIGSVVRKFDVTGGVKKKVLTGILMAKAGTEVFFVNGSKEGRLSSLLGGRRGVISSRVSTKNNPPKR
jgi:isopentenyl phosphate kinase